MRTFESSGTLAGEVKLPGLGTAGGFQGSGDNPETFFSYSDYLSPTRVLRLDVAANSVSEFRTPKVPADFSPFVTEQVFYTSKDGTRVPMFITRRKDAPRDGNQPVMLYGYGGFNVTLVAVLQPGDPVLAGDGRRVRGREPARRRRVRRGMAPGRHAAAQAERVRRLHRRRGISDPREIHQPQASRDPRPQQRRPAGGRGLTQRPDLFGAALPGVGVLDMLRYHTASANARQWSSDLGISEDPAEFKALLAYSPVHNVKPGVCYPPTLVTTADRDDRVVPWHSYKFAAELQHVQSCANPVLIRIETRAGHGAGKPIWMQIEDIADQFGFVANLDARPLTSALVSAAPLQRAPRARTR